MDTSGDVVFTLNLRPELGLNLGQGTLQETPLVKLDPKSTAPVQQVVRGLDGHGPNRDFRGIECISWWKPFSSLPGGIVVKMNLDEALEPLSRESFRMLVTVLAALVLAALAAFFAARAVAEPIQTLTAGVQRIAGGDWEHRVALSTADEIGQLSRAFDDMMNRLRAQRNELTAERQRLAEENEARRLAEERSGLILESAAEGIFGVDTEGRRWDADFCGAEPGRGLGGLGLALVCTGLPFLEFELPIEARLLFGDAETRDA